MKNKVNKLRKYVNEYVKYTKWGRVAVYWDRFTGDITVTWYTITKKKDGAGELQRYVNFTQRRFNATDIDERLTSYRNKINYAKRNG